MSARRVMLDEAAAITVAAHRLNTIVFSRVAHEIYHRNRVICCGVGKSGHVARKLAATFACTGKPALFLHGADAAHGDLGMIGRGDTVLMVSNSGETAELVALLPEIKSRAFLVAITQPMSTIGQAAVGYCLDSTVSVEALGIAPSSSCAVATAIGDALVYAVAEASGLKSEDFARLHPGGALGKRLAETV